MIKVINTSSLYASLYGVVDFCKDNEGEEIEIIVPDKLSLYMEKFLFEHLNISSSFDIKISTLNRFAKRKCVIDKEKQISKTGCVLLIHKILNDNINKLTVLKSKAFSFSYAENIYQTIAQLKASKISYQEMLMFNSKDEQLKNKILDLALVYEQYEILKAGLLDAADTFLMSTAVVAEGLIDRQILFVGFDDFTAIEYSIIERLAIENNVHILINYNTSKNKAIYNTEILSQLKNICFVNQINFLVEDKEIQFSDLKNFLQKNLFAVSEEKFVLNNEVVKVVSANSVKEELEFVARDIRYNIVNNHRYGEYGVALFGLENYIGLAKEIFSKYEINYYIDSELLLSDSIFYKFLVSVFKYNFESYNLMHLIDIINSPFFVVETNIKQKIIDKLITIAFKGKINKGFNIGVDEESEKHLISFISNFDLDSKQNLNENINKIKFGLETIKIDDLLENISLKIDLTERLVITKSKEVIYNLFDEILQFYSDATIMQLYDIFMRVAKVVKIKNLPLSLDVVKIVDANNTMEIFDNYYIVNCTSDTAPNLKFDCGVIVDAEIEKLNFKHKLSPTIAHINKLAKLRLFNSTNLFEKSLTITYTQKPSDLITDLLNKICVNTSAGNMNIVPITVDKEKHIALSLNDYIEYLCKNDKNNEKIYEKHIKNKQIYKISNKNLNIYENLKEISATQLENYFKCPFYSFMQNVLKIKPRITSEILSFDVGNILHDIMFKYYSLNKQVEDIYEFCKKEVFDFASKDDRLKLNLTSPILTALIDEAVRVVNGVNYMDENSLFQPYKFEYEFKNSTALKLKNINIKGKVDRVDLYNDMIRIIDYKSGKSEASLKELYYGNKLQLFLYSLAMENLLNKKLVGCFYLPLHNVYTKESENIYSLKGFFINEDFVIKALDKRLEIGSSSDIVNISVNTDFKAGRTKGVKKLESTEMQQLKNYSKLVTEQAVDEIRQGYIKPTPSGISEICNYCPYMQMCMRSSANRCYRNCANVALSSFKEADDE